MKILGWSNEMGGIHHYRIREPLRGLKLLGHDAHISKAVTGKLAMAQDILLVRGLHNVRNSLLWRGLAAMEDRKVQLVFDMDDDAWAWRSGSKEDQYWTNERRYNLELNIQCADLVTTPSPRLAQVLSGLNPNVEVLRNTVPAFLLKLKPAPRPNDYSNFVIGWQGAAQHIVDLQQIYTPIFRFMLRHPNVEFHLWGPTSFDELPTALTDRVKCFPWIDSTWQHYYRLNMDIGLAPLDSSDPFNETKSDIRLREYAALGIPFIASDVPAYQYTTIKANGFLATDETAWERNLEALYASESLRSIRARDARVMARDWTTEANARLWEAAYVSAIRRVHGSTAALAATAYTRVSPASSSSPGS